MGVLQDDVCMVLGSCALGSLTPDSCYADHSQYQND